MTAAGGLAAEPQRFHYRARFPARSFVPGAHASRVRGGGLEVAAVVPLHQARDPRRLDLRSSMRDPFGLWWVREFNQRASIRVQALVDVSASMGQSGHAPLARAFVRALAESAAGIGDAFGLAAFDEAGVPSLALSPTRVRAAAASAVSALEAHPFDGRSAAGLVAACAALPPRPALVFLVSDFHFPVSALDAALAAAAAHDVVPVWLQQPDAMTALPGFGLVELRDAETGRPRTVWMRPRTRARWAERLAAHRAAVIDCLARHQREALVLAGRFDADAVTDHFVARG